MSGDGEGKNWTDKRLHDPQGEEGVQREAVK